MARSQAEGINAYLNNLNPFAGWSWGAYLHEVGQFGIGEAKGAVNMVAGTVVYLLAQSPIRPAFRRHDGTQVLMFDGHTKWVKGGSDPDGDG
jgi:prepilin-type processing-associated H-X9-DG protein